MRNRQRKESGKNKESARMGISRRKFIAGSGAIVATGALAGQFFPRELHAKPIPASWNRETDVVVVGTGYAGLAAAIEAHDAGAKVVVVDKAQVIGGNSIIASGGYNAVDPERQKKQNIEDSIDLHYKHTIEGGDYRGHPDLVRYYVENALDGLHWLEKQGVEFESEVFTIVGALWPRSHAVAGGKRGAAIVMALKKQVDERNIPVLMNHALTGMYRENFLEGPILGIEAENRGKITSIKAKKAVILATGGFGADVKMRSKYDPRLTEDVPTTNAPTATGEGIRHAADVGADLTGMDFIQGLIACNYFTKKYGDLVNLGIDHAVFVNINGERFVSEDQRRDIMAEATLIQPKKVMLWVTDDRCKKRYDKEKIETIIEKGLSFRAETLEDLGKILNEKFGTPIDTFVQTIKEYNQFAKQGKDPKFEKRHENLKTIEKPPFWASPTQVGVHHTMGGIVITAPSANVLDRWGKPIPRLYAAGEVTGGIHGTNRLGGNATGDCIVYGRTAGKHAAKEKSWC